MSFSEGKPMTRKRLSQVRIGDTILDKYGEPFIVETISKFRIDNDRLIWSLGHSVTYYDIDGTTPDGNVGMFISPALIHSFPVKVTVL